MSLSEVCAVTLSFHLTVMSQYPAPPPSYGSGPSSKPYQDNATSPLLGSPRLSAGPSNGIYDQPAEGDLPDDFKYGTNVSDSSPEIRSAFVRKVYSILCELVCCWGIFEVLTGAQFVRL